MFMDHKDYTTHKNGHPNKTNAYIQHNPHPNSNEILYKPGKNDSQWLV